MKKTTILAICMAVLLVGATSGFASPLWTATGSAVYGEYDETKEFWSGTTPDLSAMPGAGSPLSLTINFTTKGLDGFSNFHVGGTGGTGYAAVPLASGSGTWTLSFDVANSDKGIYAFKAFVTSDPVDATWTMTKATLDVKTATTPIPAAGLLLGSGLLGLFGIGKARRNKKAAPAA